MKSMDSKFYKNLGPFDLNFIADKIGGKLIKPSKESKISKIENIANLEDATEKDLSFLANSKYEIYLESTKAKCIIVRDDIADKNSFENTWLIVHEDPYYAYGLALDLFYAALVQKVNKIEDSAFIHESAKIGKGAYIGHNTVIEENVEIGEGSVISSNSYIGPGVTIGKNTRIDSNVTISHSIVGDNVVILPGARIGQDGFGFSSYKGHHKKIFHIGRVIIEDQVEIGANSTIDRGALKDTIIGKNVRIDNLVQIAHNVELGQGTILVSQVGVAGSTKLGKYCAAGGQAGFAGHLTIADGSRIGGQAGVTHSIDQPGQTHFGTPSQAIREWQKQNMAIKKLLKKESK